MLRLLGSAIAISLLSVACSANDDDYSAQFREALSNMNAEVNLHASACSQADSSAAMTMETTRHEAQMARLLDHMSSVYSSMMNHCGNPSSSTMNDMMSTLRNDEDAHRSQMDGATTLDASRSACLGYATTTQQVLNRMSSMMGVEGMHCMM